MSVNPVTKEIPMQELLKARDFAENALTPAVEFSEDIEKMRRQRDHKREQSLRLLCGIITNWTSDYE